MTEINDLVIRPAQEDDLTLIIDWTLKLHHHEDDGVLKTHPDFENNLRRWLSRELENSASLYLIAQKGQRAVGFIGATQVINDNGFLAHPIKGVIHLLWLEPDVRKSGIAKQLLFDIEECFRNIGIQYCECSFTNKNTQAKKFWLNRQFKPFSISARKIL